MPQPKHYTPKPYAKTLNCQILEPEAIRRSEAWKADQAKRQRLRRGTRAMAMALFQGPGTGELHYSI